MISIDIPIQYFLIHAIFIRTEYRMKLLGLSKIYQEVLCRNVKMTMIFLGRIHPVLCVLVTELYSSFNHSPNKYTMLMM